ncbi:MAG: hypothetical protein JWQ02_156 [Capsulimonas sp.]|jgi:tRNA-splicing ligase RtcB|nr:hypothetical protein [Capsulimonas sp.]
MKLQPLLKTWKGDKRFTQISKEAAALKKAGRGADDIASALELAFGKPEALLAMRETTAPYRVYGEIGSDIDTVAVAQLRLALQLPIAAQGALMPDAHVGYALPIGGVFAAHNAISPAMVGVDIGCRMHLTLFDLSPEQLLQSREKLFEDLKAVTIFGTGGKRPHPADHAILEDDAWSLTRQTRGLQDRAAGQLGTSGSGNHFAELVIGKRLAPDGLTGVKQSFCGLLTHSGSRGVGYAIASHYMRLAALETRRKARAPKFYEWLDMDSDAGREYWTAMHLAGDFAQACHEVIHADFLQRAKLTAAATIQNHHNFAWRKGDLIIHRKGATPAEKGVLGVIPGSMGTASYIVEGLGALEALESASHGAGRVGSRTAARDRFSAAEARRMLEREDIWIEGLSVEEGPQAYKDIEHVMRIQVDAGLVRPLARMMPAAVIMAGEE